MLMTIQSLLSNQEFQKQVQHTVRTFQPKDRILHEGEQHENMYFIQTGTVRVHVSGIAGKNANIHPGIAEIGPGNIFGEVNLFDSSSACADVIAITETKLVEIDIKSLRKFLDQHNDIGYKVFDEILQTFVKRMMESNKKIIHLLAWGIEARNIDKDLE